MEHIPETDLIRRHQDFEEGERFESSDELRKMLFSGSPEGRSTLVTSFIEGTEITLKLGLLSMSQRQVVSGQLPHHKLQRTMGGRKGRTTEDERG